jgi:cytochrome c biogenesis protein CcdA
VIDILLLNAFLIGALSFFAPCSVAMLPAYIGYFLGRPSSETGARRAARGAILESFGGLGYLLAAAGLGLLLWDYSQLLDQASGQTNVGPGHAAALIAGGALMAIGLFAAGPLGSGRQGLRFGLLTSVGILAVFLTLGTAIMSVARFVDAKSLATIVIILAVGLIVLGVLGLMGKGLGITIGVKAPKRRTALGFVGFGAAYGVVSLGCNLPLFGLAIGSAFAIGGLGGGLLAFLAYAAGIGLLMVTLSVGVASGRGLTQQRLRAWMPWVTKVANVALIAAGLYIIYYEATTVFFLWVA